MAETLSVDGHRNQRLSHLLDGVVLLGLAVLVLYTVAKHEPWADEAQAWLLEGTTRGGNSSSQNFATKDTLRFGSPFSRSPFTRSTCPLFTLVTSVARWRSLASESSFFLRLFRDCYATSLHFHSFSSISTLFSPARTSSCLSSDFLRLISSPGIASDHRLWCDYRTAYPGSVPDACGIAVSLTRRFIPGN